jgi:hypothetical protein
MASIQEQNKATATKILDLIFNQKKPRRRPSSSRSATSSTAPVPTGKAAFPQTVPFVYQNLPDLTVEIKHIWAETP